MKCTNKQVIQNYLERSHIASHSFNVTPPTDHFKTLPIQELETDSVPKDYPKKLGQQLNNFVLSGQIYKASIVTFGYHHWVDSSGMKLKLVGCRINMAFPMYKDPPNL